MCESPLDPYSGLTWSLYKCAVLWRAVDGASATKRTLGTNRVEKGISSWFWVSQSRREMTYAVESEVKTHSFLPSTLVLVLIRSNSGTKRTETFASTE